MGKSIRHFFQKPFRWAGFYAGLLAAFFAFTLLDAFVIPKSYAQVIQSTAQPAGGSPLDDAGQILTSAPASTPQTTDTSYRDDHIQIDITQMRAYDTNVYVAQIRIDEASLLRTALAGGVFGRNIKTTTSSMAQEASALLAINGDYYGFRDTGYVLRNGVLYRDSFNGETLLIDRDGNFSILRQAADLTDPVAQEAWQILSFGPALIEDGQILVDADSEVSQSKSSNPRTAIGQVGPLQYVMIVSEGRTGESQGLSLLELAEQLAAHGCHTAYNLDGGGSSTMVFMGQVVNQTTDGRKNNEREVSDIVYIGYP